MFHSPLLQCFNLSLLQSPNRGCPPTSRTRAPNIGGHPRNLQFWDTKPKIGTDYWGIFMKCRLPVTNEHLHEFEYHLGTVVLEDCEWI